MSQINSSQPSVDSKSKSSLSPQGRCLQDDEQYFDESLETQSRLGENITINVDGNQTRIAFINYVVYHIVGQDKNGPIDVYRRFNQFYKMRSALTKRFPGCFIPSIPEKSISIIDQDIVDKRQRFLNGFVRRMANLPHLYYSQEFQALLRSVEKDLSNSFQKWPSPTTTEIINTYKESFSHLSGKVIDNSLKETIAAFIRGIERTNVYLYRFKIQIKSLTMKRDQFDRAFASFFTKALPNFEKQCIAQCGSFQYSPKMVFTQDFQKIHKKVADSLNKNPYWLIYDLVKREERDGCAFLQCARAIQQYNNKSLQLRIKLKQNSKQISEITSGKRQNSQLKYKLQVENEGLKREVESLQCLTDIITAIVAFVEMKRFKDEKREFYMTVLKKLGGYEFSQLSVMHDMWQEVKNCAKNAAQSQQR